MTQSEKLLRAKIPCAETGIEIKHTICDICTPGAHCGVNAYVRDGVLLKVEGNPDHPFNHGLLCTKGSANRQYIYRKDRLLTPMRRVGPRGSGTLEPISWEEAYRAIAEGLNKLKATYGPESVVFYSGYGKWYRPLLKRLAFSFGTVNYATESSCCYDATAMAWETTAGPFCVPDTANAKTMLGWAMNPHYSTHMAIEKLQAFKEKGGKLIIVDPKITPTSSKYADLHLQLRPGTDGALALGMAKVIIENGWQNKDFIERYTEGYEAFAAYAATFDLARVEAITGVPQNQIYEAARLYATNGPAVTHQSSSPVTQHQNGFQNYRAIIALSGLMGNIDCKGGMIPSYFSYNYRGAGFTTREQEFTDAVKPKEHKPRIGLGHFPVWDALMPDEFQVMDLSDRLHSQSPYPVKGLFAVGMNLRMFPDTSRLESALENLDFMVASDLFSTETLKYADIVLPACSSFERSELKVYPGGYLCLTQPAIRPLGESKSDVEMYCELSKALGLNDELLESGYEACLEFILDGLSVTMEDLRKTDLPIHCADAKPPQVGRLLEQGFHTPSGKFEFASGLIARVRSELGLDPLPTYRDSVSDADPERYPLVLVAGARIPNALHSRLHEVPWLRGMCPDPQVQMNPQDADAAGVAQGDWVEVSNETGAIRVRADLTAKVLPGNLYIFHGYREANVNQLVSGSHLDPYTGFPGYKSVRCALRKLEALPE